MAKIDITRTELVWPGKYNEDGTRTEVPRVSLPFQVIETVNVSRATREVQKEKSLGLFDMYEGKEGDTFEAGWRNKLIWGDNLLVMGSLLEKFAGKIDLIYIDPPFATGADFSFTAEIGDSGEEITKEQSVIEEKAYRDTWGGGITSYLNMLRERFQLFRELLSSKGCLYVHCDYRVNFAIRALLDEAMGKEALVNEIVWSYKTGGIGSRWFSRKHDTIFFYAKGDGYTFHPQYDKSYLTSGMANARPGTPTAEKYGLLLDEGGTYRMATARDVWDILPIYRNSPELIGYPTQKPEGLLERVISASSNMGDLVAHFFCGSGTALAVAEKLGRRWIGCDLGRWGTHVTRKRLLGIEKCKPFEVLNLGRYERQYWQGVTFADAKGKPLVLKDFVIPNTELIPEEVRSKVKKWSDFIDYWAVDWDFRNDTFMQGWVAYRTRKERKLPLACDPHTYEKAGKYRILVKVIDIFGNDTSQAFDVEVL